MAITAAFESSATIGATEYSLPNGSTTLTPITDDGIYQVLLDVSALATGDQYELKIKEKVQNAGSQRTLLTETIIGPVADGGIATPSFILLHGWDMTLKKIQGTDRAIGWSIRKVA